MKRTKRMPPLTSRAKQLLTLVVNSVALGTHDDDGEIGQLAKSMETTPGRLESLAKKLEDQGYVTLKSGFVYPTVAALHAQQPSISDQQARKVLAGLK